MKVSIVAAEEAEAWQATKRLKYAQLTLFRVTDKLARAHLTEIKGVEKKGDVRASFCW